MNIVSTELGADCVMVRLASHDGDSFETWYTALTEAVGALLDSGVFDGALCVTGHFVAKGVSCLFHGKAFVIWSDVSILIKFGTLRPRLALELIDGLKKVGQPMR
jgi:hypothetical protein